MLCACVGVGDNYRANVKEHLNRLLIDVAKNLEDGIYGMNCYTDKKLDKDFQRGARSIKMESVAAKCGLILAYDPDRHQYHTANGERICKTYYLFSVS